MLLYLIFYTFIFYSNIMPCLEISITFTVNILYHDFIKITSLIKCCNYMERTACMTIKQGVQRRQVLVVNFFLFSKLYCFALLLLYVT